MKRIILCALSMIVLCGAALQAQSKVFENNKFKSKILKNDVRYSVYLPESYGTSDRNYPVLYLLHGYSDDHTNWIQMGQVKQLADKSIASGESVEMIIVMPDGGTSWYINNHDNSVRYEDMFFEELIPHIESTYRVRKAKESRAIAGLSMGGYGSLVYALRHPDMFTAACPLSAAVFTDEEIVNMSQSQFEGYMKTVFDCSVKPEERLTDHLKKYSVFDLIKNMPDSEKWKVKLYLECGDDDFLYTGNAALWEALNKYKIPFEFIVRDGAHTWTFWREGLSHILPTVSLHFKRR